MLFLDPPSKNRKCGKATGRRRNAVDSTEQGDGWLHSVGARDACRCRLCQANVVAGVCGARARWCRAMLTSVSLRMGAGDDEVEIVPNFSFQEAFFLSGNYGPFQVRSRSCISRRSATTPAYAPTLVQAKIPARVPLWLALQLKHRQLCSIRCVRLP